MKEPLVVSLCDGFEQHHREQAAQLYWEAFRGKLGPVMRPEDKALAFLKLVANPDHAISAVSSDGHLLGLAGFKTRSGAFIGGDLKELQAIYGPVGGTWRGLALSLLERPIEAGILLMDGIFVSEAARGQGVGSALLEAIKAKAQALDCQSVRLDVIDTNPRARALYERRGFKAGRTSGIGPLRHVFGFRRATTMVWTA